MTRGVLIFNADDYGLSRSVSSGIIDAMRSGVVRSTTVMANLAQPTDIALLNEWLASGEGNSAGCTAGCHMNISCGPPLLATYPAQLLKAGPDGVPWFDKAQALDRSTWADRGLVASVAHEWELQLRSLLELGVPVSHLDSHHHVHMLPELFPVALDMAQRHGLALRVRKPLRSLARNSGLPAPDDLVEDFFGMDNLSVESLRAAVDRANGEVVEVMCHPGHVDNELQQRSGYLVERERELEVLTASGVAALLAADGWELKGYRWSETEQLA